MWCSEKEIPAEGLGNTKALLRSECGVLQPSGRMQREAGEVGLGGSGGLGYGGLYTTVLCAK